MVTGASVPRRAGDGRLRAHPMRIRRTRRPQDHHRLGLAQGLFGDPVIGLARTQSHVPPDVEALGLERLGEAPRGGLIFTVIRQEDVGHAPCASTKVALWSLATVNGAGQVRKGCQSHLPELFARRRGGFLNQPRRRALCLEQRRFPYDAGPPGQAGGGSALPFRCRQALRASAQASMERGAAPTPTAAIRPRPSPSFRACWPPSSSACCATPSIPSSPRAWPARRCAPSPPSTPSAGEQAHAMSVAERINQLGGAPDFNPKGLSGRSASEYLHRRRPGGDDPRELRRRAHRHRPLLRAHPATSPTTIRRPGR